MIVSSKQNFRKIKYCIENAVKQLKKKSSNKPRKEAFLTL